MSDLILAAAAAGGLAFAALGLSSFALWRGLRAQGTMETALRDGLAQVEGAIAALPPPPKLDTGALEAVREDVATMAGLVSGLAKGQSDLRDTLTETVTEAMGAAAAELNAQITEADKRAITRNEALRDEQQKLAEAIEGLGERLSEAIRADIAPVTETALALSAQMAAFGAPRPDAAPAATSSEARADAPSQDAEALRAALSRAVADAVAENVAAAMDAAAATLGEDVAQKLRAALAAEFAAQNSALTAAVAAGAPAAAKRAPSIFNSGRVVTLARPAPAAGDRQEA